jgi:MFS family permease
VLALAGAASISFMSTGNSTLQLTAAPGMRGRVMALWFVAFQGSTPVGGPIVGATMALLGPRAGLGLGAVTCLVVAAAATLQKFAVDGGGLVRRPLPRVIRGARETPSH